MNDIRFGQRPRYIRTSRLNSWKLYSTKSECMKNTSFWFLRESISLYTVMGMGVATLECRTSRTGETIKVHSDKHSGISSRWTCAGVHVRTVARGESCTQRFNRQSLTWRVVNGVGWTWHGTRETHEKLGYVWTAASRGSARESESLSPIREGALTVHEQIDEWVFVR